MANLKWFKSREADLEKAYRITNHQADKFPYYGTPIVYQGNTGMFRGDDGIVNWLLGRRYLFLVIETGRGERGCAGLHYLSRSKLFSFRSLRQNYNRADTIKDFNEMLDTIKIGRGDFFESLRGIFGKNKEKTDKKARAEIFSPQELPLEELINMLNPTDFGETEKRLIEEQKEKRLKEEVRKIYRESQIKEVTE